MKLNLTRQNHEKPNHQELREMRQALENIISSNLDAPNIDWQELVHTIIRFQSEDGSFNLLDSYRIESDCRVYYCHEPTYICTALLIKALLLNKDWFTGKEDCILPRALQMCCARGLRGHGFDDLQGLITAVNYFLKCNVVEFLELYPEMCPQFTEMFRSIREQFADRVKCGNFIADWGANCEDSIRKIDAAFHGTLIFVYGTLMKGQPNHAAFLSNSNFLGKGTIEGYDMYDLGCFPGIVAGSGKVSGEVYRVTNVELKCIDRLEGEGSLYRKTQTVVRMADGSTVSAFVYVYLCSVEGCPRLHGRYGEEMAWYVAYGSNLLEDRLRYYIQGGICPANGKKYSGCNNMDMPSACRQVTVPYNMFYSNFNMGSWENSAVCFLDLNKPGMAYGRAWLVTKEQLEHIHHQEGAGQRWYPEKVRLDDIDGIPAYTFGGRAEKVHEPFSRVSAEYGIVLCRGLHEAYPELGGAEIVDYLRKCGK